MQSVSDEDLEILMLPSALVEKAPLITAKFDEGEDKGW
jgi:hypothetical protein